MPKRRSGSFTGYGKRRRTNRMRPTRIVASRRRGYARVLGRAGGALVMTAEKKYFDSQLIAGTVPSATSWDATTQLDPDTTPVANIDCLFAPVVGAAINQRIGRKVAVNKITIKGSMRVAPDDAATTADAANTVRLILFQDKQTNGAQVVPSSLIQALTAAQSSAVFGFQSTANFGRFRVLKDKYFNFSNPNGFYDGMAGNQQGLLKHFKMTVHFKKPVIVHFNAVNGGTVADVVDNSFHLAANSDNNTDLSISLTYTCRVVYTDA